jgi:uncharacterized repeat protein (TIGR03803 family)
VPRTKAVLTAEALFSSCRRGGDGKWTAAVLHVFGKGKDGAAPRAGLTFDSAGNLYGTTFAGGSSGDGIVFKLAPSSNGRKETVLYSFCSLQNCSDGSEPYAGVVLDAAGNVYGTTSGGGTSGYGAVFKLAGVTETVLHAFNQSDGALPYGGLIFDAVGNLYGATTRGGRLHCGGSGGKGCGTVFQLSPSNGQWTETVLFAFYDTTGRNPSAGLVFDPAGNLYGTTNDGGAFGVGNVFEITP